jgi:ABC-type Mn2+/Zn2+ transport system permease subunit
LLTVRFSRLILGASLIGAATAVAGLYLSYWFNVASGATIVLVQSLLFITVLLLNRRTGLFARGRTTTVEQSVT